MLKKKDKILNSKQSFEEFLKELKEYLLTKGYTIVKKSNGKDSEDA